MDKMPIEFVPVQRWRVVLEAAAKVALYLLALLVILAPTAVLIFFGGAV